MTSGLRRELFGVDQAQTFLQWIDAEAVPGQIQEGEGRYDSEVHSIVLAQQGHRALGHQGRTGHGVDDGFGRLGLGASATSRSTMARYSSSKVSAAS